jgi:hypothetical protein
MQQACQHGGGEAVELQGEAGQMGAAQLAHCSTAGWQLVGLPLVHASDWLHSQYDADKPACSPAAAELAAACSILDPPAAAPPAHRVCMAYPPCLHGQAHQRLRLRLLRALCDAVVARGVREVPVEVLAGPAGWGGGGRLLQR